MNAPLFIAFIADYNWNSLSYCAHLCENMQNEVYEPAEGNWMRRKSETCKQFIKLVKLTEYCSPKVSEKVMPDGSTELLNYK